MFIAYNTSYEIDKKVTITQHGDKKPNTQVSVHVTVIMLKRWVVSSCWLNNKACDWMLALLATYDKHQKIVAASIHI